MTTPERDHTKADQHQGLYHKYNVSRVDGSDAPGRMHEGSEYFVLDLTHDIHAIDAVRAYAAACVWTHPQLATDLTLRWGEQQPPMTDWQLVPTEPTQSMIDAGVNSLENSLSVGIAGDFDKVYQDDPRCAYKAMLYAFKTSTQPAANKVAPITIEDAQAMGQKGAPPTESERLLFEAYMRGHCWYYTDTWMGTGYQDRLEYLEEQTLDPLAMQTRQLWAVWRDRAGLKGSEA